ncbi:hypothetical protein [Salinibacterium sp. ZJ454]|uniref:hypothetical protein n=1 Tax=Salinibacterium sp. ZJ454 TaxID=2708339 RepID=UPI00142208A4|nr:hypothetical protein [Salinibacterium sp. ZJ454]
MTSRAVTSYDSYLEYERLPIFARVRIRDSHSSTTSAIVLEGERAPDPPVLSALLCR